MARTVDQQHRSALVGAVADQFVAAGTARASLRELADHVGASARMLVHHFGTREQLVDAALEVARERQLAAARAVIVPGPDALEVLELVWAWFCRADTLRYFALFSEVAARERVEPARPGGFGARFGADWRAPFERVFEADDRFARDAPALAHLVIGALRGFALDLRVTGAPTDEQRRAFATLVELLAARGAAATL